MHSLTSLICPEANLVFLLHRGCGFSKAVIRSTMETSTSQQQGWSVILKAKINTQYSQ